MDVERVGKAIFTFDIGARDCSTDHWLMCTRLDIRWLRAESHAHGNCRHYVCSDISLSLELRPIFWGICLSNSKSCSCGYGLAVAGEWNENVLRRMPFNWKGNFMACRSDLTPIHCSFNPPHGISPTLQFWMDMGTRGRFVKKPKLLWFPQLSIDVQLSQVYRR
jgi:hypothetical protein